jgi:hypothetical protein
MGIPEPGIRSILILCLLIVIPFLAPETAAGAEASYLTILVPGALGTFPMSINKSMTVTGYYTTSPSTASAFIRDAGGTITTFSVRGSLWTEPESINDSGDITGFYQVVAGLPQSFIRNADGRLVTFDPPAGECAGESSQPVAINNFGEVAGNYPSPCFSSGGFTRSRSGSFLRFGLYDGCGAEYPMGILAMNSSGAILGYESCSSPYDQAGGFLLHPDGTMPGFRNAGGYTIGIGVPVSGAFESEATIPEALNDDGVVAGWYRVLPPHGVVAPTISGGFVRSPLGDYTTFQPPGTLVPPALDTVFYGNGPLWSAPRSLSLNASGVIAGTYTDAGGTKHGFVRNPYGTITPFDPPRGMQTSANCINEAGVIAGTFYYDWNTQTSIGFLRIPVK